ncbi:MAG: hypothetical protein G9473_09010 [Erythrobacter sp.]|nr:MAG: hypothetical protein G9473_09010 [Erythrobacter sp.]
MEIPPKGPDGRRMTVNRELTEDELVWHFRSGWNVAALNCVADRYQPILDAYGAFIKDNERELKRVNDRLEKVYRSQARTRREAMVARDGQTTMVYNFFALPPARTEFCAAALEMANRALASPPKDALGFARENFDQLTEPFYTFFDRYERYQRLSAEWDAKYGALYGPSQPGWVAVQQARANGVEVPRAGESDPSTTITNPSGAMSVTDPETGEKVPVVPVDERVLSQPVTQPLPTDANERETDGAGDSSEG